MKPGSRDIPVRVRFVGAELRELKKLAWAMAESFGLDSRIAAYQGKRPIQLYRWDLECIEMAVDEAVKETEAVRKGKGSRPSALKRLQGRIHALREKAFEELKGPQG
jgi:hypothetical protein